jgi:hypothetical protein
MSRAKANGDALEHDLERFHLTLSDWVVRRQHPEFVRTPKGWTPRQNHGGPPDFGAWHPAFGWVEFDAKSRDADRWEVSLLEPHQHARLKQTHTRGGIAGIYLRLRTGDFWVRFETLTVPWSAWWDRQCNGTPTLSAADGIPVVGMDWTAIVATLATRRAA